METKIKVIVMFAMLFTAPMVWVLALSTADSPLVYRVGAFQCGLIAAVIGLVLGWIAEGLVEEIRKNY